MQRGKLDGTFQGVQALRLVAAGLVVVAHATQMAHDKLSVGPGTWENGTSGVDIFFVISGFVMSLTAASLADRSDGWVQFLIRRIVRVVPMYWIATTLRLVMVLAIPALALNAAIAPDHLLASYLLVPWPNAEGGVFPFLTVGWTLILEMFFYLLVAAALFLRRPPIIFCSVIFAVLASAGAALSVFAPDMGHLPAPLAGARALTNPIVIEFIFGMMVARFAGRPWVAPWIAAALMAISFIAILTIPATGVWRAVTWGIPAALIMAMTVQIEGRIRRHVPRILLVGGDASYALYLFHPFAVAMAATVLAKLHVANVVLIAAVCLAGSFAAATVIHFVIEKPITAWLRPKSGKRQLVSDAA